MTELESQILELFRLLTASEKAAFVALVESLPSPTQGGTPERRPTHEA